MKKIVNAILISTAVVIPISVAIIEHKKYEKEHRNVDRISGLLKEIELAVKMKKSEK